MSDVHPTLDYVDLSSLRAPETLDTRPTVAGNDANSLRSRRFHRRNSRQRLSTQSKLEEVANCLSDMGWSLRSFLRAWAKEPSGNRSLEIPFRQWRTPTRRRTALADALADPEIEPLYHKPPGPFIADELDRLISKPYFGRFDHTHELATLDFSQAVVIIRETAPVWYSLAMELLANRRAYRESYSPVSEEILSKRLYMITSIVCHSRAKQQSNFLPSILDMYMLGSGMKRRVFDSFSGFGICHSYQTANRAVRELAEHSKVGSLSLSVNSALLRTLVIFYNVL